MEEKRLGGGIITCAVLNIIFYVILTFFTGVLIVARPMIEKILIEQGQGDVLNQLPEIKVIITFVIMLLFLISTIIILCKKKVGVFAYFGLVIINFVYGLVSGGRFSIIPLIIPALLAFFIYKKRSIFGFYDPKEDEVMDL